MIQLTQYRVAHKGKRLFIPEFSADAGEMFLITGQTADQADLLFKALATIVFPIEGRYRANGSDLDFSNYRRLLSFKKKVGLVWPGAALVSNLTLRQNLLMARRYFENRINIQLEDDVAALCEFLGIEQELDNPPARLGFREKLAGAAVREAAKSCDLFLCAMPEFFLSPRQLEGLFEWMGGRRGKRPITLIYTQDKRMLWHRDFKPLRLARRGEEAVLETPVSKPGARPPEQSPAMPD